MGFELTTSCDTGAVLYQLTRGLLWEFLGGDVPLGPRNP